MITRGSHTRNLNIGGGNECHQRCEMVTNLWLFVGCSLSFFFMMSVKQARTTYLWYDSAGFGIKPLTSKISSQHSVSTTPPCVVKKKNWPWQDSNLQSSDSKSDALSIRPHSHLQVLGIYELSSVHGSRLKIWRPLEVSWRRRLRRGHFRHLLITTMWLKCCCDEDVGERRYPRSGWCNMNERRYGPRSKWCNKRDRGR